MDTAIFSRYLLPIVIGLIMFNLGLSLRFKDFRRIYFSPRALIVGLCCQLVLLPGIAFILAYLSGLPPAIQVGIVLIAACPGGATSNLITYLLKGDVALSISLTSLNSVLILFSIPGITYLALVAFSEQGEVISLPFPDTVLKIIAMILLPTFLGILARRNIPELAKKTEKYLKYITTVLLAVVFIFTILHNEKETSNSFQLFVKIAPYALLLNLAGMASGYIVGYLARLSVKRVVTLVIEIGIQNSALAITIASSPVFLGNDEMAIPAVVYGMFTFFNAVLFGYLVKKWFRKRMD